MKKISLFLVVVFSLLIFFVPVLKKGFIPFPGDYLVSEFNPWRQYPFLGFNKGSYPNKAQYFDVIRQIYPWKTLSINLLKAKELPLWNPYNFSGSPLMANFQSAVFYPLSFFYFLFSQITAWSILVYLQIILMAFFTYFYCRKINLSSIAAVFSAVAFSLSSFCAVLFEYNTILHVILWMPLSLLTIENLLEKQTSKWKIILILSVLFSQLAGHLQIFVYSLMFLMSYAIFFDESAAKRNSRSIFICFLLALGLGAFQLIPGFELISLSARSAHDFEELAYKLLIQPWQIIMLFIPDFFGNPATRNYWLGDTYAAKMAYIGIIPLLFFPLSLAGNREKRVFFFIMAGVVILIFTTLNPISYFFYRIKIPFFSSSAPNNSLFILCFILAILSGFGIDKWLRGEFYPSKTSRYLLGIGIGVAMIWFLTFALSKTSLSFAKELSRVSLRNLVIPSLVLFIGMAGLALGSFKKRLQYPILLFLLIVLFFDLSRIFLKYNAIVTNDFIYPEVPIARYLKNNNDISRSWGYGSAYIDGNLATQLQIYSPDGYDPLYPRRYGEFIQSSKEGLIVSNFTSKTRSDAMIEPGYGVENLSANPFRLRVLDVLGVKYVLDRTENGSTEITFSPDRFNLLYEKDDWKIFENSKAAPRFFLAQDYKVVKNTKEFQNIFFAKNFDPAKTILLETDPGFKIASKNNIFELKLLSYQSNNIKIHVSVKENTLLFLSDTYYPGWKAMVDGKQTQIYRADYAFRSIFVPAGSHDVFFTYKPASFKIGLIISAISMLLVFYFFSYAKKFF